jgi:hypothetical protein
MLRRSGGDGVGRGPGRRRKMTQTATSPAATAVGALRLDPGLVQPVFIFGCQRSGTTMLASQLANGDNAFALPEIAFAYRALRAVAGPEASLRALHADFTSDFFYRANGVAFPFEAFAAAAADPDPRALLLAYCARHLAERSQPVDPARRMVWFEHSPLNRDYFPALLATYPNARFIHVVRDPRPIYLSMRDNPWFPESDPFSAAMTWIESVPKGRLHATRHPDRVIETRYEDVLADPERELRRLCGFVGLEFTPAMLQGGAVRLPAFTRSQHALTTGGVQKSKIGGWRDQITAEEDRILCALCNLWMLEYGYLDKPVYDRIPFRIKLRHYLAGAPRRLQGKIAVWRVDRRTRIGKD